MIARARVNERVKLLRVSFEIEEQECETDGGNSL